jgi:DNA-binding NarL/FixJ family response regulator
LNTLFIVCQDPQHAAQQRISLEATPELRVLGIDAHQRRACAVVTDLRPEVLVTTLRAQDGPVLSLLQELRDRNAPHRPKVLLITPSADDPRLLDALRAGGDSYWVETAGPGVSLAARVTQLLRGEAEMSASIARALLLHFKRGERGLRASQVAEMLNPLVLNGGERTVLQALADGLAVPEVAVEQRLSLHQVRTRIHAIYRKLHWDCKASTFSLAA